MRDGPVGQSHSLPAQEACQNARVAKICDRCRVQDRHFTAAWGGCHPAVYSITPGAPGLAVFETWEFSVTESTDSTDLKPVEPQVTLCLRAGC